MGVAEPKGEIDVLKRALIGATVGAISLVSFSTVAGASDKSQANAWAKQDNAEAILRKVSLDAVAFVKAGDAANRKKIIASCNSLSRDVPTAQHLPPIPVASFESLWSRSLADLSKGASTCLAAYTARDENQLGRAKSLAEKGARQVNAGIALLEKLSNEA
jgi:hypothetical protein